MFSTSANNPNVLIEVKDNEKKEDKNIPPVVVQVPSLKDMILDRHFFKIIQHAANNPTLFNLCDEIYSNYLFDLFLQIEKAHIQIRELCIPGQVPDDKKNEVAKLESDIRICLVKAKRILKHNPALLYEKRQRIINHFCKLTVLGLPAEIKELLGLHPQMALFLFEEGSAQNYSHQTIKGSPFQCMLGARDFFHDMLSIYYDAINQVEDGRDIAIKQLVKQLPEYKPEFSEEFPELKEPITKSKEYFDVIDKYWVALHFEYFINDVNQNTKDALKELREKLKKLCPTEINQGWHFDEELIYYILHLLYNNPWGQDKTELFIEEIIYFIMPYLPTHFAQTLCQTTTNLNVEKLDRELKSPHDNSFFYKDFPMPNSDFINFKKWFHQFTPDEKNQMYMNYNKVRKFTHNIFRWDVEKLKALHKMKMDSFREFRAWLKIPAPKLKLNC